MNAATEHQLGRRERPSLLAEYSEPMCDLEAERAALGAGLLVAPVLEQLAEILEPEDFYLASHQRIFSEMLALRAEGTPVDPIILANRLSADEEVIARGGAAYIAALPQLSVPAVNGAHHARIVSEHSRKRKAARVAQTMLLGDIDVGEAIRALSDLGPTDRADVLPTVSAIEFCQETPDEPDWVMEGYLARGAITELDAKIKTGKTHFTCDLIRSVLSGEPFLGRLTTRVPVLYLTEERRTSFRSVLARVGLDQTDGLDIAFRHGAKTAWAETGRVIVGRAKTLGTGLVVVDTLSDWAGLEADKENDAGAALVAMRPLQEMAAAGLAVLVLRHERKSGGEVGDSARGSSAFGGAADVLLSLQKDASLGHENRRILGAVGRLEGWAPKLILEMTDGRYQSLGTNTQVEAEKAREIILAALPTIKDEAFTEKQLLEQSDDEVSRSTLKRALKELVDTGRVKKAKGVGNASSRAFGFWSTGGGES